MYEDHCSFFPFVVLIHRFCCVSFKILENWSYSNIEWLLNMIDFPFSILCNIFPLTYLLKTFILGGRKIHFLSIILLLSEFLLQVLLGTHSSIKCLRDIENKSLGSVLNLFSVNKTMKINVVCCSKMIWMTSNEAWSMCLSVSNEETILLVWNMIIFLKRHLDLFNVKILLSLLKQLYMITFFQCHYLLSLFSYSSQIQGFLMACRFWFGLILKLNLK